MSIEVINWVINQKVGSPTDKAVLMALANYFQHGQGAYPGHNLIKRFTEYSKSTIKRSIKRLQEKGFIEVSERFDKNGRQTSNLYIICTKGGGYQGEPPEGIRENPSGVQSNPLYNSNKNNRDIYTRNFLEWYDIYPRKVGKKNAFKAFEKSLAEVGFDELIDRTKKYAKKLSEVKKDEQFIPYPATWLSRAGWEDDFSAIVGSKTKSKSKNKTAYEKVQEVMNR